MKKTSVDNWYWYWFFRIPLWFGSFRKFPWPSIFRKCTKLLFSSEVSGLEKPFQLQVIELENVRGRHNLWKKVKLSLQHVWENYNNTFDYLLKADDDTFVVMENLMSRLSRMSPEKKFLLGHKQSDQVLFISFSKWMK